MLNIQVSNYWFGPGEVEAALEELDGVVEAAVWGEYDTETGDDRVSVAVVVRPGEPKLTEQQIVEHVANHLQVQ